MSQAQTDQADKLSNSSTNLDSLVGRIVVEQGLATPEEVQACLEMQRQKAHDQNEDSLASLLVRNQFITNRQAERTLREVEAQRSTQQIPGYVIKKKLGAGAMASVYLARQMSLDRLVAIKVLPKKFSSNASFIERFYQEGRAAAQLNHPNIVQAYDVGRAGEYHYFVMEFVKGRTVYDDIIKHKRYTESEAIEIVLQMADALQHAHDRGFLHRDVKPKNIMITEEGVAKLADMGLARALSDKEAAEQEKGRAFGTPYYISPEQIRGAVNIGPQADIYSLGATLYHMVTGQVPFDGKNPTEVMHRHLKADLVLPDHVNPRLSAGISEVIEMMMEKDPRKRYQTCRDVITDLRLVQSGKPPAIAHKEHVDLTGLTQGEIIEEPLEMQYQRLVANQLTERPSLFSHPAFLLILVLLLVSIMGNVLLLIA